MTGRIKAITLALLAPLILWGCVITPGKFVSTLTILADRSFTFTYVGEVYAIDMGKEFAKGMAEGSSDDDSETAEDKPAVLTKTGWQDKDKPEPKAEDDGESFSDKAEADKAADTERKNQAIAEALSKEAGYRKVTYVGGGKFEIDYAISGRLTHNFLFPFNSDAEVLFPFVMLELRGPDRVRVKAPAFGANNTSKSGMGLPDTGGAQAKADGTFTLTTDAELVSQNNEDGAATGANGRKVVTWKVTPTTKDAPMAVLKVAPL